MTAKRSIPLIAVLLLAGCATVPPPEPTEPATVVATPTDAEINATFE